MARNTSRNSARNTSRNSAKRTTSRNSAEIMLEILLEIQDVNSMKKETVCSLLFILNILDNSPLALNYFLY